MPRSSSRHDEVRRLAALAERERIGRDLHDLLGHTLSLVALKSELAGKLVDRDPAAARRELDEVDARRARGAGPGAQRGHRHPRRRPGRRTGLGAAAAGIGRRRVRATTGAGRVAAGDVETVLAMTLREAVTNIQRHARARIGAARRSQSTASEVVLRDRSTMAAAADRAGQRPVPACANASRRWAGGLRVDSAPVAAPASRRSLPLPARRRSATPVPRRRRDESRRVRERSGVCYRARCRCT